MPSQMMHNSETMRMKQESSIDRPSENPLAVDGKSFAMKKHGGDINMAR